MIMRILTTFTCLVLLFSGCRKDSGPVIIPPPVVPPVSFSQDIQPIFDVACISCHNEWHASLNLQDSVSWRELWTTGANAPYVDTLNPLQSILHLRLTGAQLPAMPPSTPLTQAEIDLIDKWMEEGARDN